MKYWYAFLALIGRPTIVKLSFGKSKSYPSGWHCCQQDHYIMLCTTVAEVLRFINRRVL